MEKIIRSNTIFTLITVSFADTRSFNTACVGFGARVNIYLYAHKVKKVNSSGLKIAIALAVDTKEYKDNHVDNVEYEDDYF